MNALNFVFRGSWKQLYRIGVCGLFGLALVQGVGAQAKYEPPDGSIYLGYCASGYWSPGQLDRTLETIRTQVSEKPFLLYSMFVHAKENGRWNGWKFRQNGPGGRPVHGSGRYIEAIRDRGYTPVVAWTWMDWLDHSQSPTIQGLLRGEYDWYLDEWIAGIKEFEDPIFIRLSHEMDGYWYPYSEGYLKDPDRNTAEEYISYWRYVVDRFRAAGVDNVAWVWCVSGGRQGVRDWVDYYPGDGYVDWLGVDVYSNRDGGQTLLELREALGDEKPIMIPEGGTEDLLSPYHPDFPGNAAWVREFYETILYRMGGQVKAVCWFQWNEVSYLQRDAQQLRAYRDYVSRDAFISELFEPASSDSLRAREALSVDLPEQLVLSRGESTILRAEVAPGGAERGSKWTIRGGDPGGLRLQAEGRRISIEALKAGEYRLKFEAWDGRTNDSDYTVIRVDRGASREAPGVELPDRVSLRAGEGSTTIFAKVKGLEPDFGGNWSVLDDDGRGLALSDNLTAATVLALKPGKYRLKAQFWDSNHHVSGYVEIEVSEGGGGEPGALQQIIAPDVAEIRSDGASYRLEAEVAGFVPKGSRWSVESGPPGGLRISGRGALASLRAREKGSYLVKFQAWKGRIHVSKHILVIAE